MTNIQLITDGSCMGNPGPGGWACILRYGDEERELSGGEAQTTNNRMELTAAINGLKVLRETCEVELVTDSQYLKQGITQHCRGGRQMGGEPQIESQYRTRTCGVSWMMWHLNTPSVGLGLLATAIMI